MKHLLEFLGRLDQERLPYHLSSVRSDALMVHLAIPGERWEVEFMSDGAVEVERFTSSGIIDDETAIDELWARLEEDGRPVAREGVATGASAVELKNAANALIGKTCWGVSTGAVGGSRFDLKLGEKIPRDVELANQNISLDVRSFEPECSLFVKGCPWRMETESEVIGSWLDENVNDGPMGNALNQLVGGRISRVRLEQPAWDFMVTFDNGFTLCLFSDATKLTEFGESYSVSLPDRVVGVEGGGKITVEWIVVADNTVQ